MRLGAREARQNRNIKVFIVLDKEFNLRLKIGQLEWILLVSRDQTDQQTLITRVIFHRK